MYTNANGTSGWFADENGNSDWYYIT
jgi:hypothetical protein